MRHRRGGFTLVEVLVVVGLVVILGAALLPVVTGGLDNARIRASAETLEALSLGIHNPARGAGSFQRHVGAYPRALSHLTRQIVAGEVNSCLATYTTDQLNAWAGPYVNRTITGAGVPIPIGTVRDTLERVVVADPAGGGREQVTLKIFIADVHQAEAEALGRTVDGFVSATTGMVQWGTADADGLVTVEYLVPAREC